LQAQLAALDAAGVAVDRIVPQAQPGSPSHGHFEHDGSVMGHGLRLVWSRPDGVLVIRPSGGLAHHLLAGAGDDDGETSWSAEPAAATAAEQELGHSVEIVAAPEAALRAARSDWNLRQFELAARPRGIRALRKVWHELASPAWRPMRWGVVILLVVNLIGLNAWAWMQRSALAERQKAQVALLQTTFPHVRAVLDAPVQMQRETEQLRSKAGKPGDTDLEPMLQAVASAWPEGRRLEALKFEPGQLSVSVEGWPEEQVEQVRARLQPAGWQVSRDGSQLSIRRAAAPSGGRT
jgi:general secretion pathway protein L